MRGVGGRRLSVLDRGLLHPIEEVDGDEGEGSQLGAGVGGREQREG